MDIRDEMVSAQVQEILNKSMECPSCHGTDVDVCWMSSESGKTGWDCICGHSWETKQANC